MAATRLIALHVNKGKTAAASIRDRLDYSLNPEKTQEGAFVSAYECDPHLAWREFSLAREMYLQQNARAFVQDVIGYQIRQSFKPGEIMPEEANRVGYETAMRFTKGKHAFTVSTHVDRAHVHNHIIFCSVSLEGDRKFRDFWRSGLALQKVSDQVCMEHHLSVITRRGDQALHQNGYRYERPAIANAKGTYQKTGHHSEKKRYGKKELPFSLLVDIEAKIREGKGVGYEKWAKTFNLQQSAKALLYLQESGIDSWEKLYEKEAEANDRFHELQEAIRTREARLNELGSLKKSIVEYSKTRAVYEAYRKAGHSEKIFEAHRAELTIHKAAKKSFDEYKKTHPEIRKLPTVKEITAEYGAVLAEKKELYQQYGTAKEEMQKINIARRNVETLLGEKIENHVPEKGPSKKDRSHRDEAR